jgi:dienelactone hydrolase
MVPSGSRAFSFLASAVTLLMLPGCLNPQRPTDGGGATPAPSSPPCDPAQYLERMPGEPTIMRDVLYSQVSDRFGVHELRMDIYQPVGNTAPSLPAIVWVHGGGFQFGNKDQLSAFAREFAARGYVTAAIDYRLLRRYVPNATTAMAVDIAQSDAQAAIRFLRAHAADVALDKTRIAIAGWSAGSVTAFNVGYRHDFTGDNTDNPGPPPTVSTVMGMDGLVVTPADLRPNDSPFILFSSALSSDADDPTAIPAFLARADALGLPHERYVVSGATHNDLINPPFSQFIIAQAAPFLRKFVACR